MKDVTILFYHILSSYNKIFCHARFRNIKQESDRFPFYQYNMSFLRSNKIDCLQYDFKIYQAPLLLTTSIYQNWNIWSNFVATKHSVQSYQYKRHDMCIITQNETIWSSGYNPPITSNVSNNQLHILCYRYQGSSPNASRKFTTNFIFVKHCIILAHSDNII